MEVSLFDFELPMELIAQTPAEKRDESRLLLIDKDNKTYEDKIFHDIIDYLRPGDVFFLQESLAKKKVLEHTLKFFYFTKSKVMFGNVWRVMLVQSKLARLFPSKMAS